MNQARGNSLLVGVGVGGGVAIVAFTGLWLALPLLRPWLWPAPGAALIVVLDGFDRLPSAWDLQRQRRSPLLLIACPASFPYSSDPGALVKAPGPVRVLGQGSDTVTQMVALDRWLATAPFPVGEVLLVSDRRHLGRAAAVAQLAIGSRGIRVTPVVAVSAVSESLGERFWVLLRDRIRITAWRASGSTLAFLRWRQWASNERRCRGER